MRKVTEKIARAFVSESSLSVSNTTTDGKAVWLHGNKIIERRPDGIWFSLCGWNTATTRERLNGVLYMINASAYVSTRNGQAFVMCGDKMKYIEDYEWVNLNEVRQCL
jgi:hypothetical protein